MDLLGCAAYHSLALQAEGRSPATLRLLGQPPAPPPAPRQTSVSELLNGLDADERRALLKALLHAEG